jgi:hypothetical protein
MQNVVHAPVVVTSEKSVGLAIVLAIFFGPLGMLYATVPGALIMLVITPVAAFFTLGLSLFVTWPICVVWAGVAASQHNQKLVVPVSSYQTWGYQNQQAMPTYYQPAQPPAFTQPAASVPQPPPTYRAPELAQPSSTADTNPMLPPINPDIAGQIPHPPATTSPWANRPAPGDPPTR